MVFASAAEPSGAARGLSRPFGVTRARSVTAPARLGPPGCLSERPRPSPTPRWGPAGPLASRHGETLTQRGDDGHQDGGALLCASRDRGVSPPSAQQTRGKARDRQATERTVNGRTDTGPRPRPPGQRRPSPTLRAGGGRARRTSVRKRRSTKPRRPRPQRGREGGTEHTFPPRCRCSYRLPPPPLGTRARGGRFSQNRPNEEERQNREGV